MTRGIAPPRTLPEAVQTGSRARVQESVLVRVVVPSSVRRFRSFLASALCKQSLKAAVLSSRPSASTDPPLNVRGRANRRVKGFLVRVRVKRVSARVKNEDHFRVNFDLDRRRKGRTPHSRSLNSPSQPSLQLHLEHRFPSTLPPIASTAQHRPRPSALRPPAA